MNHRFRSKLDRIKLKVVRHMSYDKSKALPTVHSYKCENIVARVGYRRQTDNFGVSYVIKKRLYICSTNLR